MNRNGLKPNTGSEEEEEEEEDDEEFCLFLVSVASFLYDSPPFSYRLGTVNCGVLERVRDGNYVCLTLKVIFIFSLIIIK